jgi:hypothetical protein
MIEELDIYWTTSYVICSVCTNVEDQKRIEELTNQKHPTGTSNCHWMISPVKHFGNGKSNPYPCEEKPETHKHYLMEC